MFNADNLGGATLEILIMLLVAFLLGYLLRFFIGSKWKKHFDNLEAENLTLTNNLAASNSKIKNLEDSNNYLRKELDENKRSLAIEKSKNVNGQGSSIGHSANAMLSSTPGKVGASNPAVTATKGKTTGAVKSKTTSAKKVQAKSSSSSKKKTTVKKESAPVKKKSNKKDDLKVVEGIGPKIQELFNAAGIYSFDDLAAAKMTELRKILKDAGPRYRMHNPKTWPRQARMASQGKWKKLEELQDSLKGGKKA